MRKFDYGFLDNGLLPASIVDITSGIDSLRMSAGERKKQYISVFTELDSIAKVQSYRYQ